MSLSFIGLSVPLIGQTVTGSGTPNTIPIFTGSSSAGSSTLGSSVITAAGPTVGIGGSPSSSYEVDVSGGTNAPAHFSSTNSSYGALVDIQSYADNDVGIRFFGSTANNGWTAGLNHLNSNFTIASGVETPSLLSQNTTFNVTQTGNVGIGTASPSARFELNGNMKMTAGTGSSITFPDSTIQSTAWNGTTFGGDYAESVDLGGDSKEFSPGDVLVMDSTSPGKFIKATTSYSTLVAGIYSTKPGLVGRRQSADRGEEPTAVPMALVGIVPTKVGAENGPIKTGDLLVTSTTPGYAMKGTDRSLLTGAIVGKAMGKLDSGSGVIEVLVTL